MNQPPLPEPFEVSYAASRNAIIAMITERLDSADTSGEPGGVGAVRIPSCPEWDVQALLEHVLGIAEGVTGGQPVLPPEGEASGLSVSELLQAWARVGVELDQLLKDRARRGGSLLVMDTFSHELDLGEAFGIAPPAQHPAYAASLTLLLKGFDASVRSHGLPALSIRSQGEQWQVGEGDAAATLTVSNYEIVRMLTGRLSVQHLRALDWSQDPTPWLPAFTWGLFTPHPD